MRPNWLLKFISNYKWLPYARHHKPLLIRSHSWIQAIHKDRIFWKNLLKNKEMVFENGVNNIQAAAYNGARTVLTLNPVNFEILLHVGNFVASIWTRLWKSWYQTSRCAKIVLLLKAQMRFSLFFHATNYCMNILQLKHDRIITVSNFKGITNSNLIPDKSSINKNTETLETFEKELAWINIIFISIIQANSSQVESSKIE